MDGEVGSAMDLGQEVFLETLRRLVTLTHSMEAAVRATPMSHGYVLRHRNLLTPQARPDYLYVILSGWAARYDLRSNGSRRITGLMLPGDFCGIHAVTGSEIDHTIVALTDCEIGKIAIADLIDLVARAPATMTALWRAKLVEEAILRKWLLFSAETLQSVARLFCELQARLYTAGACQQGVCEIPLTQEQIGDVTGRTGVHINRTIQKLRALGLITYDNNTLNILQPIELRYIGQFNERYLTPWKTNV